MITQRISQSAFLTTPAAAAAAGVIARLRERGFEAFLAGGCVRDAILGEEINDFDVATSARPEEVIPLFDRVVETGIRYGTVTIIDHAQDPQVEIQVTTFRKDAEYSDGRHPGSLTFGVSLEEDAARRDLTMNALFADPATGEVLDCVDGLEDLRAKRIRAVGIAADRFDEDALRLLRTLRFAAKYQFEIDTETRRAARARPHLLKKLSAERVAGELSKMLVGRNVGIAIALLENYSYFDVIAPEVAAMRGVPQPPQFHKIGDVFRHTLDVVERLEKRDLTLALAGLFHDVGKVTTLSVSDRIRFHGHEPDSCRLAFERLRLLKYSNEIIANVIDLIAEHIRIGGYHLWRRAKQVRFLQKENVEDHLILHKADCGSAHDMLDNYHRMCADLAALRSAPPPVKPLLTGADLIQFGLKPGKEFKKILEAVRDWQLEGKICTRDEALRMVRAEFPITS
ncbi:MAG: CCA tRNA nucleotidyltransferase [Planctomycetota bacterium]